MRKKPDGSRKNKLQSFANEARKNVLNKKIENNNTYVGIQNLNIKKMNLLAKLYTSDKISFNEFDKRTKEIEKENLEIEYKIINNYRPLTDRVVYAGSIKNRYVKIRPLK